MKRFALLLLCLIPVALTQVVDPRGARPVEHGTRSEKCAAQREWPFCLDVDWGSKCPSGCRVQGLMDRSDNDLLRKIERIRNLLDENRARYRSTDQVSKQTYSYLKEKLTTDSGNDNSYYDLAQNLRQRISDLKMKIDRQLKILGALKDRVRDQVTDMQRLEVDIDIKLRSCKGSCSGYVEHRVDLESYVSLDKQVQQLSTQSAQSIEAVGSLYVMKSRPLKDVLVSSIYKSKDVAGQQKEDMFPEVKTVQLVLEEEGSSSSPATISKVPGTSFSSSSSSSSTSSTASSSSSSSSSSTASKSITELGGRGDGDFFGGLGSSFDSQPSTGHVSTQTISCTKSIRRTVVHTKDGPVERVEEVTDGGPDCQVTDLTKGGMGSLFPSLSHTSSSSSSSSSSSKTVHNDGTKGSLLVDFKSGFNPFGGDLGAFMTDNADDDVPDFHARSVKTARVERQDDFVGKDCVEAFQKHRKGETSGLFRIRPGGAESSSSEEEVEVFCQQEGLMGGWLLFQQREGGGALEFNRTWAEYRDGFGSVDSRGRGELWLGNRNLHLLSGAGGGGEGETLLKVELEDWEGARVSAEYLVRVGPEGEGFPLWVSGYSGDAGDALAAHNGAKFSTLDSDNDGWGGSCARAFGGGGWWYHACQDANLNGVHRRGNRDPKEAENGVVWNTFKPANYSLKTARMLLRPATF